MSNEKLASLLIHEMFHCFQLSNLEKRFPNEILGIYYPITFENISLRMQERQYLLEASQEKNKAQKLKLLTQYFNIRDKRETLFKDSLEYEKSIATVEGMAVYVEFKALTQLVDLKEELILEGFTEGFAKNSKENLKIRNSSLNQGLLLCLIADEYILNWQTDFFKSSQFLSDFIKLKLRIKEVVFDDKDEPFAEIIMYLNDYETEMNRMFDIFENNGELNILKDNFRITGFDPTNILKRNDEMIHINFLRVKIGEAEQVIKGPVQVITGDNFFDVKQIEWSYQR